MVAVEIDSGVASGPVIGTFDGELAVFVVVNEEESKGSESGGESEEIEEDLEGFVRWGHGVMGS